MSHITYGHSSSIIIMKYSIHLIYILVYQILTRLYRRVKSICVPNKSCTVHTHVPQFLRNELERAQSELSITGEFSQPRSVQSNVRRVRGPNRDMRVEIATGQEECAFRK